MTASDGVTYERQEFSNWLMSHGATSPSTGKTLESATVYPAHAIKQLSQLFTAPTELTEQQRAIREYTAAQLEYSRAHFQTNEDLLHTVSDALQCVLV